MAEIFSYTAFRQVSQLLLSIAFFNGSEYILAVAIHGKTNVTLKSLLISRNYLLAMVISLVEYFIEISLFPTLKQIWVVSNFGLAVVVIGEIIRKMAIITAGRSFTHLIKIYHEEHHDLVTHGIFGYIRHPSYCGFFIWSVGTQIMLCNPVSTIGFSVVVWKFFKNRIPYEEFFLRQFFGSAYAEYARTVPSGVPFINRIFSPIPAKDVIWQANHPQNSIGCTFPEMLCKVIYDTAEPMSCNAPRARVIDTNLFMKGLVREINTYTNPSICLNFGRSWSETVGCVVTGQPMSNATSWG